MALFKFTKAILAGEKIDVYNHGNMSRDFTYIDDLVVGIRLLIDSAVPSDKETFASASNENKSPVAPFRVVNIGNSMPAKLLDFINAIETATGHKAKINWMPIQPGDVPSTWADTSLLSDLTNFTPKTDLAVGVKKFVSWYTKFYKIT